MTQQGLGQAGGDRPLHQRTNNKRTRPLLFNPKLEHSLEQTSPCPRSTQQQFGSLRTVEPGIWYFLRHQSQRRAVLFSAVPVGIPARVGGDQQRSLGCSGKYGAFDLAALQATPICTSNTSRLHPQRAPGAA